MDHFENIVKTLLEHNGYWVRQSFKVNLTKDEKRNINKPSIPRPEIDLLAYRPTENEIIAIEVKSFFNSPGVKIADIKLEHAYPEGRYKLFTCKKYRDIVLDRLRMDLKKSGMIHGEETLRLGLAAGNIYQSKSCEFRAYFDERNWFFWSPEDIKSEVMKLATHGYENDPAIITAKILNKL